MSETKNLKLFKHDEPLETNENQFNIKKALHDNWDKLDEFGGKVNTKTVEIENKQKQHDTDISNIKQEQQEQNLKIESNSTESKDNTELLNQIMGLLPSTKGEGEHVTLDDTAEARFKHFYVQGNSKQETRTGKNKLPYPYKDLSSTVIQDLGDGRLILNGTLAENTYKVIQTFELKAGKYKILFSKTNISNGSYILMSGKTSGQILQGNRANTSFELTNDDTVTLGISILKGTYNQAPLDFMILEATEQDETFEQYGASPSPEFPSKIRNVGDNINLFNKDGNTLLEYDSKLAPIENGIKGTLTVAGTSKYCVTKLGGSELLGKTLIVHGNAIFSGKNDSLIGFYFGTNNDFAGNWIADSGIISKEYPKIERIFKIPDTFPEGKDTIYILFYVNARSPEAKVGDYVEYRDFKIEEGTQATAYSPYNCGNAEITVGNKNLANTKIIKNTNIITVNEDGSITLANNSNDSGYIYTKKKLKELCKGLKVGDTAYLKIITTSLKHIYLQGKHNNYWFDNKSLEITEDILEDIVCIYGGYKKTDTLQIQITKNAIGDYAQNEQQSILFPFTEGQRLHKGDYLAEDGIHHTRKQIVLDGTEAWQLGGGGTNVINQRFYLFNNLIKTNGEVMSNYFKQIYKGSTDIFNNDVEGCNISNGQYIQIKINKKIASTVEQLNNWIKQKKNEGNPLTFECELENEIIEPYTPEQQETYNQLKKLHSYNEQTNIFSKDEISPIFNAEAIKNLNVSVLQQTTKES